jgi:hypothetical protein
MKDLDFQNLKNNSEYISVEDFFERFDKYYKNAKSDFKKLETLQYYHEDSSSPMWVYFKGDTKSFINSLEKFKQDELGDVSTGNLSEKRIHFIDYPISKYLEYEYYTYVVSSTLSQDIKILPTPKNQNLSDFVIFDDAKLLIHDYDEGGKLVGAYDFLGSDEQIAKLSQVYDQLYKSSLDFESMFEPDKNIISKFQ